MIRRGFDSGHRRRTARRDAVPAPCPRRRKARRSCWRCLAFRRSFASTIAYVAEKQGFFKKHGADVEIRPFDNGTAAARAVISGDIDLAFSPTPPVINQISNAGVPLVAVYGMANPDWVLGTIDSGKTCKDVVGQEVGVDSIGGARSVALRAMLDRLPGRQDRTTSSRSRSAPTPRRR